MKALQHRARHRLGAPTFLTEHTNLREEPIGNGTRAIPRSSNPSQENNTQTSQSRFRSKNSLRPQAGRRCCSVALRLPCFLSKTNAGQAGMRQRAGQRHLAPGAGKRPHGAKPNKRSQPDSRAPRTDCSPRSASLSPWRAHVSTKQRS